MSDDVPEVIRADERAAVLNGLAHAAALYEQLPSNWIRIGETRVVQEILGRLAPPARTKCDTAVPMALRMARKHVNALKNMKPENRGEET